MKSNAIRLFPDGAAGPHQGLLFVAWPWGRAKLLHDHLVLRRTGRKGVLLPREHTELLSLSLWLSLSREGRAGEHQGEARESQHPVAVITNEAGSLHQRKGTALKVTRDGGSAEFCRPPSAHKERRTGQGWGSRPVPAVEGGRSCCASLGEPSSLTGDSHLPLPIPPETAAQATQIRTAPQ